MEGTNRLGDSTSPYLLQHAGNPVHWWPWSEEAFAAARHRDIPVLLSVGYATCHWCHVMAHESFEDPATADDMNRWFVSVKVDREERPDVDRVYMDAVQAMTGRGGWPMTVFLTPDGRPFFAGTYFPPADRHGHPSFRRVLAAVHEAWNERRLEVEAAATRLTSAVDVSVPARSGLPDQAALTGAVTAIVATHDPIRGGFGGAPKFPQAPTLDFLIRVATTPWGSDGLTAATTTLRAMANGGIHDHIGGGFARYSVDAQWSVPHFEKMLSDNAQLAGLYARAAVVTADPHFAAVAHSTVGYLLRDLRLPDGGFASGEDADSEGEEGTFYVFRHDEVIAAAGALAVPVAEVLGSTPRGNFEGRTVLSRSADPAAVADRHGMPRDELLAATTATVHRLGELRSERIRPARDDKVVTAWNALAIRALVDAAIHLDTPEYLEAAAQTGRFLLEHLRPGRLHRSWRDGRLGPTGFCEDHAALALGCFALFSATGEETWYQEGAALCEELLARFADDSAGGFWATAHDAERLITRPKNLFDNPSPSDNALAAEAMLFMAAYTGESRWLDRAEGVLRIAGTLLEQHPGFVGNLLSVAATLVVGLTEVAVVGADRRELMAVIHAEVRPTVFVAPADDGRPDHPVPLLRGRHPIGGAATAHVCRGHVCDRPTTAADDLADTLRRALGSPAPKFPS